MSSETVTLEVRATRRLNDHGKASDREIAALHAIIEGVVEAFNEHHELDVWVV